MKKFILLALIGIICILVILVAVGCIRPIIPGSYVGIVYPAPGAVVPTEFSVLAVGAKWSFGIETNALLFLGTSESHVALPPSLVELTLDGVPYARSNGGNHHVFRVTAPPGDHTVGLTTPYGKTEVALRVTESPPVVCAPMEGIETYAASVDALTKALFDFVQTSPSFSFPDDPNAQRLQKIFLAGDGAFILFGATRGQFLSACEVRYIAPIGGGVTADDIGNAPALFSWDGASWERPVKLVAAGGGEDRFSLVVFDDAALTVFSIFPDGSTDRADVPLSDIRPGLAETISAASFIDIRTKTGRDLLYITLDTYGMDSPPPGRVDIVVSGRTAKTIDLGERLVDGITPAGDLITLYPAPVTGPLDTALVTDAGKTSAYLPLPVADGAFAFTAGSVRNADDFYPEYPRFEIGPPVPCTDCTGQYVPVHYGVAGDVTFGPDIIRTALGGREAYFIMRHDGNE